MPYAVKCNGYRCSIVPYASFIFMHVSRLHLLLLVQSTNDQSPSHVNSLKFSLANVTFDEVSIFVQVLTERLSFIVDMFQVLEVFRKARLLCACLTIFVVAHYARTACTECRVFDVVRRPAATLHSGSTAAVFLGLRLRRSSLSKTTSTKLDARIPGLHRCRSPT